MEHLKAIMSVSTYRRWMMKAEAGEEIEVKDKMKDQYKSFLLAFAFEQARKEDQQQVVKAVQGVRTHTTAETDRNMAHATSTIQRALSMVTGKDVELLMRVDEGKKLDITNSSAVVSHYDKFAGVQLQLASCTAEEVKEKAVVEEAAVEKGEEECESSEEEARVRLSPEEMAALYKRHQSEFE